MRDETEVQLLHDEAEACTRCPLHRTRQHVAIYRGSAVQPDILFVGEAPGAEEDSLGLPFVGDSGRLLEGEVLTRLPVGTNVGYINVVNCRPPKNVWRTEYGKACAGFTDWKLRLYRPSALIVTVGNRARDILGEKYGLLPTIRLGGVEVPRTHLIHPSAVMRSRTRNTPIWEGHWTTIVKTLGSLHAPVQRTL